MKSLITKILAIFILSQLMPITMMTTLPEENSLDAYTAGLIFDTMVAGLVFVIYGAMFFDDWRPKYWPRINATQLKVIAAYSILAVLVYQLIPSLLTISVYFNPIIHTTCKGAYGFGWLINLFITLVAMDFYFGDQITKRPEYYSI